MNHKPTILLFHLETPNQANRIQAALIPIGIRVRTIPPEDYGKALGLIAGTSEDVSLKDGKDTVPLSSEMMIFVNLTSSMLNQVLQILHKKKLGAFPFKAMLTPTNSHWSANYCFSQISEEHYALLEQEKNQQP